MPMTNRMNRMVSFRLSEEEYDHVMQMLSDGSARSISDIARTAMSELIKHGDNTHRGDVLARVGQLEEEVAQLKDKLASLTSVAAVGH